MRRNFRAHAIVLALAMPAGALADASGLISIPAGMNFSFDAGAVSSSGGDISFSSGVTGTQITVVGAATAAPFSTASVKVSDDGGAVGIVAYNYITQYTLTSVQQDDGGQFFTVPLNDLAFGYYYAVLTNGGNLAKFVVLSANAQALQIQWYTYQTGTVTATGNTPLPTITFVINGASYQGNGVAAGSLAVIKGSNLSPSGVFPSSFPLPTSSNGVTVNIWPGNFGLGNVPPTPAYVLSLYNQNGVNQIAVIVPSSLAPATYTFEVSNSNGYGFMEVNILAAGPGLLTQDSSGNGAALAQNYVSQSEVDLNRLTTGTVNGTTISPAHPGQTLTAWGTGLGPISGADNVAATPFNFITAGASVVAYVGGMAIPASYAGRAPGFAGIDQINFTLPDNVPTGCTVPFQVAENGTLSQATFLSIAPNGDAMACVQPGFNAATLENLDNGGLFTYGYASVDVGLAGAGFASFTGAELGYAAVLVAPPSSGCVVSQIPASPGTQPALGPDVALDAGTMTLTGPAGSGMVNATLTSKGPILSQLVAGTYTMTGTGGKDVGPFTANLIVPTPVTFGSLPAVVNRSAGLTVTWTGGNPDDLITVQGQALVYASSGETSSYTGASFRCTTTAGAGSLTVPASVLGQLPAVVPAANGTGSIGNMQLGWQTTPTSSNGDFSAPLTAGGMINVGIFFASALTGGNVTFQ